MTAEQQESELTTHSPRPSLSRQDKHQLAVLIANMIEMHLSSQVNLEAEFAANPPDEVHSASDDFASRNISIKEDCHAHHRSAFDQNHRHAPGEDRLRLSASIEHGAGS